MAVKPVRVSGEDIAVAPASRLDVRYYALTRLINPFFAGLFNAPMAAESLDGIGNGTNLPASTYADDFPDASALYASVKSLSQFALRESSCIPLLADNGRLHKSEVKVEDVAVSAAEVLLTRSGTPGIAWPAALSVGELPVIPSGFIIRLQVNEAWNPVYVASVLNHPCWRLLSLALSAGKRQDNIGHSALMSVPLPQLNEESQSELADLYINTLTRIEKVFADEPLTQICDSILTSTLGFDAPPIETRPVSISIIKLSEVGSTPSLRVDNRWHGSANRLIRDVLSGQSVALGELLGGLPVKGRQPEFLEQEAEEGALAIATSTLQGGQVVMEYAKPITAASADHFPVGVGDLLVAMDGDGSLGKAGVVGSHDSQLTVDSHIAVLPVAGSSELKLALACWLNSTWGRTQTTGLMTGATGQTQLRPSDLMNVLVPEILIDRYKAVADAYEQTLISFESPPRRARQLICDGAVAMTTTFIENGALRLGGQVAAEFTSPISLRGLLDLAYPSVVAF